MKIPLALGLAALAVRGFAAVAGDSAASAEFFESEVRPLLERRCWKCHSEVKGKAKGGLMLDSLVEIMAGGDSGEAVIVPHDPKNSLMIAAVRRGNKDLAMPPDAEDALTDDEIGTLEKWIGLGAPWPGAQTVAPAAAGKSFDENARQWWSFQPVCKPGTPAAGDRWARSEIDRLIAAGYARQGLSPAPDADARTLIRRLHLDLTGLPPTPEEVAEFTRVFSASRDRAVEQLVDRLLASPHYGERWGRHWLDAARYADTQGDTGDVPMQDIWKYRNWVIAAHNRDLPIDEFIRLQIAGDIYAREKGAADTAAYREQVVATGFIAAARRYGNSRADIHLTIEDTLDTLGRGVLGLTLRCARCHDHKFDPISNRDYYALYGIFQSTRYPWNGTSDLRIPQHLVSLNADPGAQGALDEHWARLDLLDQQIRRNGRPVSKAKTLRDRYEEMERKIGEIRSAGEDVAGLIAEQNKLANVMPGDREFIEHGLEWLKKERDRLGQEQPGGEIAFAVLDQPKPANARIQRKGDPKSLGPEVPRGFLEVISGPAPRPVAAGSGRRELAEWVTDPAHPLTARVFVNRVWQQHFGVGIVPTADNFGRMGEPPLNPELLDWLAATLVEDGWSLKRLHRRIVLSRVYQLASDRTGAAGGRDPDNKYLWRFNRRLLDAETVRDSLLFVSGQLDPTPGGAHPFPPVWDKGFAGFNLNRPFSAFYATRKRSVYVMTPRLRPHPELDLFNGPDRNASTARRTSASITPQALFLMNSPFITECAASFARRTATAENDAQRIERAFQLALGRPPDPEELSHLAHFVAEYPAVEGEGVPREAAAAWPALAKVVLSSNEFFFLP
ncbi:MAG: DUF1553 domain-containing protein [Opitutus sp.]|nr:DUF1553 domain-containing protein [Opitutus sp.]